MLLSGAKFHGADCLSFAARGNLGRKVQRMVAGVPWQGLMGIGVAVFLIALGAVWV